MPRRRRQLLTTLKMGTCIIDDGQRRRPTDRRRLFLNYREKLEPINKVTSLKIRLAAAFTKERRVWQHLAFHQLSSFFHLVFLAALKLRLKKQGLSRAGIAAKKKAECTDSALKLASLHRGRRTHDKTEHLIRKSTTYFPPYCFPLSFAPPYVTMVAAKKFTRRRD